jgi:hypothetical protein
MSFFRAMETVVGLGLAGAVLAQNANQNAAAANQTRGDQLFATAQWYVEYARTQMLAIAELPEADQLSALRALDRELNPLAAEIRNEIAWARGQIPRYASTKMMTIMVNKELDDLWKGVALVGESLKTVMIAAGDNPARWAKPVITTIERKSEWEWAKPGNSQMAFLDDAKPFPALLPAPAKNPGRPGLLFMVTIGMLGLACLLGFIGTLAH